MDLGDDGGGELLLLALLDLAFVADPGVEDGLGFSGDGRLLLELKGLGLELGGFLEGEFVSIFLAQGLIFFFLTRYHVDNHVPCTMFFLPSILS